MTYCLCKNVLLRPAAKKTPSGQQTERQCVQKCRRRLAGAGIRSVPFRTVADKPIGGDYISEMRVNIKQLEESTAD